jgi:hypothetical protein
MKVQIIRALAISLLSLAGANLPLPANAQSDTPPPDTGRIRVNVSPEEAYIWVDDKATSHRSTTLKLHGACGQVSLFRQRREQARLAWQYVVFYCKSNQLGIAVDAECFHDAIFMKCHCARRES